MAAAPSAMKQELTPPTDVSEDTQSPLQSATYARAACTECARRKQKCNREWPCNHCKKRKVGNQCRYNHDSPPVTSRSATAAPPQDTKRKRDLSEEDGAAVDGTVDDAVDYGGEGFEALGYSTVHLFARLSTRDETTVKKTASKELFKAAETCPQLARALQLLPPRPHTDSLVQNFLNNVNYHYYIIYAPNFLEEYQAWWKDRVAHRPLSIQWTCLLLMICACSCQYTDAELQKRLEEDLSESVQTLTDRYHNAGRELYTVISVGHSHLLNVQALLHSCYWYKGEVRFIECWHVLASAIREAQELGIHQESHAGAMSEFEREMRRRIWCILDTWDWQISALLGRPLIIDRSDCDIGLPSLSLEDYNPSPLLHMKLQSQLIGKMSKAFTLPKYVVTAEDVKKCQQMIETWIASFPKCYDYENPDRSQDDKQPWMKLHRHYLHTMGTSMILGPIRPFLAKNMSRQSPPEELQIRRDGIKYCLKLMESLYGFFGHVYPRDSKFHFVIFCVFDTASVICSTIIHDEDDSAPRKDELLEAIDGALGMLKQLTDVTANAKTSYQVLERIAVRARAAAGKLGSAGQVKRTRFTTARGPVAAQEELILQNHEAAPSTTSPFNASLNGFASNPPQHNEVTSMGYPNLHPPSGIDDNSYYNGFQQEALPQHINYSMAPQYPMQGFMPQTQTTFAPQAPPAYDMNGMGGMPQAPPVGHGYGTMPQHVSSGISYANEVPQHGQVPGLDFSAITQEELGQLEAMWHYRSLNLDFINPQP
ncbi:hypothetical protein NLU13_8496 [Sarocladium strictum]|uniref:Zn(2)-C6 fungal-type domain-containing protein n=1 Tax=Sarocladium strictum TaxID=5046 RepID=A0AA39L595_SARSR|nr:hypothetical protein NLU13_8496 [Sarocladium strictum]